jgi:CRISPR system Cascade subunit CasA
LIQGFTLRHGGMNHEGAWIHPLTPYAFDEAGVPAALHMPRGGLGYRNWPALVTGRSERKVRREPALAVQNALRMVRGRLRKLVVQAFGYDVDNAKIRGWYEHRAPAYALQPEAVSLLRELAGDMVTAATEVAGNLRSALKAAWKVEKSPEFALAAFWKETEPGFLSLLDELVASLGDDGAEVEVLHRWHAVLRQTSEAIFETWAEAADMGAADPGRIARAHLALRRSNWKGAIRNALRLPEQHKTAKGGRT